MGKVSGSYESVVRGVSEQNPQARRSGQHFAQVNMISDPVRGLARRHGSILQDEVNKAPIADYQDYLAQTAGSRVTTFFVGGVEYDLIARTTPATGLVSVGTFAQCFNKDARTFVPIVYEEASTPLIGLIEGGLSAAVNVGRYLLLAGNTIIPTATNNDAWGSASNQRLLAGWVRAGAYARTFKVTLVKSDNTKIDAEYTTKTSSYPGLLDTSDILATDTEYQKKVNDRVNAYNSAVTAWLGEAAQDITPENIAQKLVDNLVIAGVAPADIRREGSYVVIDSTAYKEIDMEDNGDDTLARGVGNTIANLDLVSSRHFVGKVVKVEPADAIGDPVYLRAYAKDDVSTGWTEVVWRESAGYEMTPQVVFCIATVEGGTLYVAGSASGLETISGISDVPGYMANTVGDDLSSPLPEFFGKGIDYLGMFQDRLVIGTGATLFFSRPGDYFNWFRASVLSIQDNDPWEGYALGAEDDVIKYSVLYDRSLLLYGKRFQYVVNGRTIITPNTASVAIVSSYEDAIDAAPKGSGNFVFYCKESGVPTKKVSSLHQVQPGVVADVSDSYTASQQLDTYLAGKPVELVTLTSPNMVLLRTDKDRQRVFVYTYLDNPNNNERLFDSWSHWEWAPEVGQVIGISRHEADILVYMVKQGPDIGDVARTWISCERFVRDTDLSDYPYLDSLRPWSSFEDADADTFLHDGSDNLDKVSVVIQSGNDEAFLGDKLPNRVRFFGSYAALSDQMWVGYDMPAYVTPTNPYARDRNDNPILGGRLTLGKVRVSVTDTGGMKVTVNLRGINRDSLNFTGRILGQPSNLVGRQPIVTTDLSAIIGGEVRECLYTISAVRWLPLTVNSIEWQGQHFFNTRRA